MDPASPPPRFHLLLALEARPTPQELARIVAPILGASERDERQRLRAGCGWIACDLSAPLADELADALAAGGIAAHRLPAERIDPAPELLSLRQLVISDEGLLAGYRFEDEPIPYASIGRIDFLAHELPPPPPRRRGRGAGAGGALKTSPEEKARAAFERDARLLATARGGEFSERVVAIAELRKRHSLELLIVTEAPRRILTVEYGMRILGPFEPTQSWNERVVTLVGEILARRGRAALTPESESFWSRLDPASILCAGPLERERRATWLSALLQLHDRHSS